MTSGDTNGAGVPREHPGSLHVTRKAPIPGSRARGAPTTSGSQSKESSRKGTSLPRPPHLNETHVHSIVFYVSVCSRNDLHRNPEARPAGLEPATCGFEERGDGLLRVARRCGNRLPQPNTPIHVAGCGGLNQRVRVKLESNSRENGGRASGKATGSNAAGVVVEGFVSLPAHPLVKALCRVVLRGFQL